MDKSGKNAVREIDHAVGADLVCLGKKFLQRIFSYNFRFTVFLTG
jgi:hypothetical protein